MAQLGPCDRGAPVLTSTRIFIAHPRGEPAPILCAVAPFMPRGSLAAYLGVVCLAFPI